MCPNLMRSSCQSASYLPKRTISLHIQKEELAANSPSQNAVHFDLATINFVWKNGDRSAIQATVQCRGRLVGAAKWCLNIFTGIMQIIPKSFVPVCRYSSMKITDGFAKAGNFWTTSVRTRSQGISALHYK